MNKLLRLSLVLIAFCLNLNLLFGAGVTRIVSLAPSLTMNLYYLEVQSKLVGCTSYCEIAKKDKKEIVASAVKVNIEKVVSLKPDLVIATTITNPETIKSLQKFGIHVEVFPTAKSFNDICLQFIRLGKLVGKESFAQTLINTSKAQVEALKKSMKKTTSQKVFFQIGSKPLFSVLTNTFMNDHILFAGATNIFAELNKGTVTREAVLARNPDIIIIVTMGMVGEEEKKTWESYSQLSATRKKQVYIIDSELACTPTPLSFVKTFETITKLISHK